MKKLLVTLLFVLSLNCFATTYFVDATGTGTGTANGSSVSNQCAGPADADCTAATGGDTVYLCNVGTSVTLADSGTSNTNRLTYDASCPGGTAFEVNGADANDVCLTITGSHLNVNGVTGDPWNPTSTTLTKVHDCNKRGIMLRTALSNVTVRYFDTYNINGTTQSDQEGAGFIVDNVTSVGTTSQVSNIKFEYMYSHGNGAFGFATSSNGNGIYCDYCRLDYNGALYHGGGAFIHPYRSTLTSGWTVVSGDIYGRDSLSATDDVDVVYWIDQRQFLTDIGTCGSPAAGEFCYTVGAPGAGTLRVNLGVGVVPNGQSIQYRRGPLTNVVISNSSASYNYASDGTHGAGFQPDDLAGSVLVRSSWANNNEGSGFKAYRNQGTIFEGIVSWNNGLDSGNSNGDRSGIHTDESTGTIVRQATSANNAVYGFQQGYGTSTTYNMILAGNADFGARAVAGTTTLNYTDFYQNTGGTTTTASGGSVTNNNSSTARPYFLKESSQTRVSDFGLRKESTLRRTGTSLNLGNIYGADKKAFYVQNPSFGGIEITSNSEAASRTTASTRTARQ